MKRTKLPVIFSIVGALGVIATGALASFSTIKAIEMLEREEDKKLDELEFNKETVSKVWKYYIPSMVIAVGSIVSIITSNRINTKFNTLLAAGLATYAKSYKKYREEIVKENPELDRKVLMRMADDYYISPDGLDFSKKVIFYDSLSDRMFKSSWVEVMDAMYHFNRNFQLRGYGYLNELYDFIGIDRTTVGDIFGYYLDWFYDGGLLPWIDYSITHEKSANGSEDYYNLSFTWPAIDMNSVGDEYAFPTINEPEYYISQT